MTLALSMQSRPQLLSAGYFPVQDASNVFFIPRTNPTSTTSSGTAGHHPLTITCNEATAAAAALAPPHPHQQHHQQQPLKLSSIAPSAAVTPQSPLESFSSNSPISLSMLSSMNIFSSSPIHTPTSPAYFVAARSSGDFSSFSLNVPSAQPQQQPQPQQQQQPQPQPQPQPNSPLSQKIDKPLQIPAGFVSSHLKQASNFAQFTTIPVNILAGGDQKAAGSLLAKGDLRIVDGGDAAGRSATISPSDDGLVPRFPSATNTTTTTIAQAATLSEQSNTMLGSAVSSQASIGSEASADVDGFRGARAKWTHEEDERVLDLVSKHGRNWRNIAAELGSGRTGKQIRERWKNQLRTGIIKGKWTKDDLRHFPQLFLKHGRKWARIAFEMGRSENSVKNYFHQTFSKSEECRLLTQGSSKSKQ